MKRGKNQSYKKGDKLYKDDLEEKNTKGYMIDILSLVIEGYAWYPYIMTENKKNIEKIDIFFFVDLVISLMYVFFIGIALFIGVRKIIKVIVNIFWRE